MDGLVLPKKPFLDLPLDLCPPGTSPVRKELLVSRLKIFY